jgi:hypothetical protein
MIIHINAKRTWTLNSASFDLHGKMEHCLGGAKGVGGSKVKVWVDARYNFEWRGELCYTVIRVNSSANMLEDYVDLLKQYHFYRH